MPTASAFIERGTLSGFILHLLFVSYEITSTRLRTKYIAGLPLFIEKYTVGKIIYWLNFYCSKISVENSEIFKEWNIYLSILF